MADLEASLQFFRGLPQEDRRYLRGDVTKKDFVEGMIRRAERGEAHRLVAVDGDRIVALGVLDYSAGWRSHLGEIRVIVAPAYQRKRLGRLLMEDLFNEAVRREVEKVVVKLVEPQETARLYCEQIGFHVDAVLPDYVKDTAGRSHALVVMSCTLDDVWRALHDFYSGDDWPDG